ncbi:MAG: DUF3108 domain-containing protein [Calditrichaeota bacterium]|nr:DUF3108 domain-containing protein [Calditrichota bacterium]
MKYLILIHILVFTGISQTLTYNDSLKLKADSMYIQPFVNNAFVPGERLNFKIKWKASFISITGGYAKMQVLDTVRVRNRKCYLIMVTAESTPFIENFYEVRDTIKSYIDVEYGMSWKFVKKTREASYFVDIFIDYDHVRGTADVREYRYKNREGTEIERQEIYSTEIYPFTQDILSSFYFMRANRVESGFPYKIPNNSKRKNYYLRVLVNPIEEQSVNAGDFNAFRVLPIIEGESIFNQEGAMVIWMTNDKRHLPIRMKSAVSVGSINVELESYSGLAK